MTQTKTGAFLSMGRIPHLLGNGALAAGLMTGGISLLNAGGAMATNCDQPAPAGPNGMTYAFISDTPAYPGVGVCRDVLRNGNIKTTSVDYDFTPNELTGAASGEFRYSITAAPGDYFFNVLVDSDVDVPGGVTVTKSLYSDSNFTQLIAPPSPIISTDGSNSGFIPITPNTYNTLWVKDVYSAPAGTVLDNFTNTYQTPGPLPILGAGAAFGFSRKLRGRIKAARLS